MKKTTKVKETSSRYFVIQDDKIIGIVDEVIEDYKPEGMEQYTISHKVKSVSGSDKGELIPADEDLFNEIMDSKKSLKIEDLEYKEGKIKEKKP